MKMKIHLIVASFFVLPLSFAQSAKIGGPVKILSEPEKLVAGPNALAKDCSPEEKLAIDCRELILVLDKKFFDFKDEVIRGIDYEESDLRDSLKKAKFGSSLKTELARFKSGEFDEAEKVEFLKKIGIKPEPDINCHLGPDFLYTWFEKYKQCGTGFTRKDPYAVTKKDIVVEKSGVFLQVCTDVKYKSYGLTFCGKKNLLTGKMSVDKKGPLKATTMIEEVRGPDDHAKVYHFKDIKTYDLTNLRSLVAEEVKAQHPECVSFLPKK